MPPAHKCRNPIFLIGKRVKPKAESQLEISQLKISQLKISTAATKSRRWERPGLLSRAPRML